MHYFMYQRPMTLLEQAPLLPPGLAVEFWRPSLARPVHPRLAGLPFLGWSLFHFARVFRNRDYGILLLRQGSAVVHRTCILPAFFRFPFLAPADLQAAGIWTAPELRGRGLALAVMGLVLRRLEDPGRTLWYMAGVDNRSSIRLAQKAGFAPFGRVVRKRFLDQGILGHFHLQETF